MLLLLILFRIASIDAVARCAAAALRYKMLLLFTDAIQAALVEPFFLALVQHVLLLRFFNCDVPVVCYLLFCFAATLLFVLLKDVLALLKVGNAATSTNAVMLAFADPLVWKHPGCDNYDGTG